MRTPYQIVADHYAASDRHDLAAMFADVANDVQWTEMAGFPCAGTHVGPAQVVEKVFQVLGAEWEGYRFVLERLVDGGDTVVGIGDYHARHRKTGKPMQARVTHVWQVQGGKVRRFEQFTDTLLVARAMQP
ncbi:SnoaL-like domain protein [compost metagenome]|uniref:nuclear transport factor 2 family protein n=1 Tax=Variovorax TaxID=34072 RepID=UPI00078580FC|nr:MULTISPECIES: nuclear transport factor 2 family protein [Variovorax]OEZ27180.1 ketosteroid isomerase [Variovorax boronicumulans]TSD55176.1 nuclear transport factor 2 family protein [Variovorax sp. KBS0712]